MGSPRNPDAPLIVPCYEELYWKLISEAGRHRMSHIEFAQYCLEQMTKHVKLEKKPRLGKKDDV